MQWDLSYKHSLYKEQSLIQVAAGVLPAALLIVITVIDGVCAVRGFFSFSNVFGYLKQAPSLPLCLSSINTSLV